MCEDIVVSFSGGPGNATDWIAIYPQGIIPDGSPPASLWLYTNGTQISGGSATSGSVTFSNPSLVAGNYSLWFLQNDGYTVLDGPVHFTITDPPTTDPPSWLVSTFHRRHAVSGAAYTGKISAYTNHNSYTYSKLSGPAWLAISATGNLTGTPTAGDAGMNSFTVRASNGEDTADATMTIEVFKSGTEEVRQLKIMSYNAWHGWGQINNGHRKGLESIILSGADVIGMQESHDNVSGSNVYQPQKIANDLGWYYRSSLSGSLGLISRYPITDQTLAAGIARGIKVRLTSDPVQEIILMNCHLDYTHYDPYAARQSGATEASVLAEETSSDRDEQINVIMPAMSTMLSNASNIPVFLTGDFNAPSHLDWVASTASSHNGIPSVAWPTSTAVLNAGMLDSFRTIHPDPAALSGNTWSPTFKGSEPQDRIDFVYFKGSSVTPVASQMFTTAVENTVGAWGSSITPLLDNTWPSDHSAVISIFKLASVDADADGLSDAFENKYFGNTTSQSGSDDKDGDGSTNKQEQLLGTNPDSPLSKPLTNITLPTSPQTAPTVTFSLSATAHAGGLVCERSTDLTNWNTVWSYQADPTFESSSVSATETSPGQWSLTLTDNAVDVGTAPRFFYRLREGS
ncbi:MAG: endonuclease/exonuclease/phosphatase family protein [Akkermansiaceae bacterium]